MTRITILGATGPTGMQLVTQALDAGHEVTVLVRDGSRLDPKASVQPTLSVVTGDATRPTDLVTALVGNEVVISALGPGKDRKSDIASRAATALVAATADTGVSRAIVMSAFGVGRSLEQAGRFQKALIGQVMGRLFADKALGDDTVRDSHLDWTLVYPVGLSNGPRSGRVRAGEQLDVSLRSRISRADVAGFMLAQIADNTWSRRTVLIAGR